MSKLLSQRLEKFFHGKVFFRIKTFVSSISDFEQKNSAFWRKFFSRLVKIAFTCPEEHREDQFFGKKLSMLFLDLDRNKIDLMERIFDRLIKTGLNLTRDSLSRNYVSEKVSSINSGVWANNLRRFDKIVLAGFLKLHLRVQKNIVRTFYVWIKFYFFVLFWPCPKQNQPNGIYFFAIVVKTAFNRTIGAFWGEVFLKKYIILINFGQWAEQFRRFGETLSTSSHNCTVRVPWNAFSKVVFLRLWAFNHF